MKKVLFLLFVIPLLSYGQSNPGLADLMTSSPERDLILARSKITTLVTHLQLHRGQSEIGFLRRVFHQTERSFLQQYEPYSEFPQIFTSGKFDCLTATSLFSVVLDELQVKYRIIETNYHIFIMVSTSKGDVLLETTDRLQGFVTNSREIDRRIRGYNLAGNSSLANDHQIYQYHFKLFHDVNPGELTGLLYYNKAVRAFNASDLSSAAEFLCKAFSVYNSPRIHEFTSVLIKTVEFSKMDDRSKNRLLEKLRSISLSGVADLAVR